MLLGEYPNSTDYQNAYLGLSIGAIGSIIGGIVIFKAITQSEFYSKVNEYKPQRKEEGFSISKGYEKFIGDIGETVTDLRPSGKIVINDRVYQAMSTGEYIESGNKVIVVKIDENQLVVKKNNF